MFLKRSICITFRQSVSQRVVQSCFVRWRTKWLIRHHVVSDQQASEVCHSCIYFAEIVLVKVAVIGKITDSNVNTFETVAKSDSVVYNEIKSDGQIGSSDAFTACSLSHLQSLVSRNENI